MALTVIVGSKESPESEEEIQSKFDPASGMGGDHLGGQTREGDSGSYYPPRVGVVVVSKRRRDFGRNTPLTLRDLSDLFPPREWANPRRSAIRERPSLSY